MPRYRSRKAGGYVSNDYARAHPEDVVEEPVETDYATDADSDLGVLREDATPEVPGATVI